jgi:phospholipase/carboxylesterase
MATPTGNPHLGTATVLAGAPLHDARRVAIVVHGRDQEPAYMLENLVVPLGLDDVAYVLPSAAASSWYPGRFFEPRVLNEPWLEHAMAALDAALVQARQAGFGAERTVLVGFSQGGCLVAEHAARRPARYAGVAVLTGALIGAADETWVPDAGASPLAGLQAYFGTRAADDWVPAQRVRDSATAYAVAGAAVSLDVREPGPHVIDPEDVRAVRALLVA